MLLFNFELVLPEMPLEWESTGSGTKKYLPTKMDVLTSKEYSVGFRCFGCMWYIEKLSMYIYVLHA